MQLKLTALKFTAKIVAERNNLGGINPQAIAGIITKSQI